MSLLQGNRKWASIDLTLKSSIITYEQKHPGIKHTDLASHFGAGKDVYKTLKNKVKYLEALNVSTQSSKRIKPAVQSEIDTTLLIWFRESVQQIYLLEVQFLKKKLYK